MATDLHANLTGADLHEPKGAAAASVNQVYVANGSGSGTWQKISTASINLSSLKLINTIQFSGAIPDVSTNGSNYLVPVPTNCTLNSISVTRESKILCILFIIKELIKSQFKNYMLGPTTLWKPDCDCTSESLRAAMGTLWR